MAEHAAFRRARLVAHGLHGGVGTVVAFWLFMAGVVRIGSMRATLLATIEPVTATISSVLWTGSVFTPVDIVGFVLILIMSFLVQ